MLHSIVRLLALLSLLTFRADIPLLFMYVMGRRIPTDLSFTLTEQYSP